MSTYHRVMDQKYFYIIQFTYHNIFFKHSPLFTGAFFASLQGPKLTNATDNCIHQNGLSLLGFIDPFACVVPENNRPSACFIFSVYIDRVTCCIDKRQSKQTEASEGTAAISRNL